MPLRLLRGAKSAVADEAAALARADVLDQVEAVGVGLFWATDAEGRIAYLSAHACAALGRSAADLIGRAFTDVFSDGGDAILERSQRTIGLRMRSQSRIENQVLRLELPEAAGAPAVSRWWRVSARPYLDPRGTFLGYRGSAIDITKDYDRHIEAAQDAQFDPLTGLANRRRMEGRFTALLAACKVAGRSCALMMLDLDRFKAVNDTLGHPAGDELLKQVARRLEAIVKDKGEIGRLGGDEFLIILPDMDDRGELTDLANRLIQMVSQPYVIQDRRVIIGTSVGVAIAPYDGIDVDEMVSAADMALYAAKGSGRGTLRFFNRDLRDAASRGRQIEDELRDAIQRGELRLNYQPLVDPETNRVRAFEALMRWQPADGGAPVSPAVFIPVAEQSELIIRLGEWALRRACEDAAQWPGDLRVAVNVSAKQFMNEDFARTVQAALDKSGLEPGRLDLEITESVFVGDVEAVDQMFVALKKIGVRLTMDDFGTGYSSLGYLQRAPFDKIKIDQSFVRGCTEGGRTNPAIISAIVGLARALDMESVAEGVEALDELAMVRQRGVDLVQGYIYSRPLDQAAILARLESGEFGFVPSGPAHWRADRKSVFRKIGLIHEDHYYTVMLRNISKTGAWIEGLGGVPKGTDFVLDLGGGQLVVSKVARTSESGQGVKFEFELISDGADGLMTRHRVSPYALASAGMPLAALPSSHQTLAHRLANNSSPAKFLQLEV